MNDEHQLNDTSLSAPEPSAPPWLRKRRRHVVRRVGGHMETRLSFGILTLGTMGMSGAAILVVVAVVGPVVYLAMGQELHALVLFLAALGLAVLAGGFGLGMGIIGLPFVGDWFLEWPSHAVGWSIGVGGCALLALLLFLTPLPAYAALLLSMAAVFAAGYFLAYGLRTTRPVPANHRPQDEADPEHNGREHR
jgi:hypothetical protein